MARERASVSFLEKDKDKGKTTPGKEFPPFCSGPWLSRARGDCEVQVRPAYLSLINMVDWPGIMAHTCYPSNQKA